MRAKILLLEEDSVFASHLKKGLADLGCEVILIREGGEGLARAVTEKFDLVVVSAELPNVNGFRICNRIKKDANAMLTPVFLMSSDAAGVSAHEGTPTHADRYFAKPVALDELRAQVSLVLGDGESGPKSLGSALEDFGDRLTGLVELELRITEQERTIKDLNRQLVEARAPKVVSSGEMPALAGLALTTPPPSLPKTPHSSGAMLAARPAPPPLPNVPRPALPSVIDGDAAASDARKLGRVEKQLAAAHADRESANRRAKEAGARAEKMRAELETAREQWKSEREKLETLAKTAATTADDAAVALAAEREQLAKENDDLRKRVTALAADHVKAKKLAEDRTATTRSVDAELKGLRAELQREKAEADKNVAAARAELASLRTRLTKELAKTLDHECEEMHRRATDEIAEVVARAGDLVRSLYTQIETVEKDRDERLAARDRDWQQRLEEAVEERASVRELAEATRMADERAALEAATKDANAKAAAAEARIRSLTAEIAAEHAAHQKTRAAGEAQRADLAARIDALEALAAARAQTISDLEREVETARGEVPQLEAEIMVLRTEVLSLRRELENMEITARASAAQLERDRQIVDRAKKLLEELTRNEVA